MPRKFSTPARLLWGGLAIAAAPHVHAHDPFEITAVAQLRPGTLEIDITMARSTALAVATHVAEAPTFEPADFPRYHAVFVAAAPGLFLITAGGQPLAMRMAEVSLGREKDVDFHLVYPAPAAGPLRFEALHVARLPYGYGNSLVVRDHAGVRGSALLDPAAPVLEIALPSTVAPAPPPPFGKLFTSFLGLGTEHIITGYDHLLFLLGLLVTCLRLRNMFVILTCFTLAHSITLALAAFGVVAIPGRIVEPIIAASNVFVGVENLLHLEESPRRWTLTLLFGLIHGFGFATALREAGVGLSGTTLGVPLFAFNLGVELGQLGVVAAVFPLLLWLRRWPAFIRIGQPALSAIVVIAGTWWLLQRPVFA